MRVALAVGELSYPIDGGGGRSELSGMMVQSWYGSGACCGAGCCGILLDGGGPCGGMKVLVVLEKACEGGGPDGGAYSASLGLE